MINPYPQLPKDRTGESLQDYPAPKPANTRYSSENASVSSVITLSKDTTAIEIVSIGAPAVMRWVASTDTQASVISAASGANFDHAVPTVWVRRFAVPIETSYQAPSSMVGANTLNGLYQRVAYKSIGAASVMVTEY